MSKTFVAAICPRCKKEGAVTSGAELFAMRGELESAGWRFDGKVWRCAECYQQWVLNRKDQKLAKGERGE